MQATSNIGKGILVLVGCTVFNVNAGTAAISSAASFPYRGITLRNVFNLRERPAPILVPRRAAWVPKVRLTLITTILGVKQAGFEWTVPPTRPGEHPKVESPILSVGQATSGLEVLDIDEVEGRVKVRNHDEVQTLTFTTSAANPVHRSVASR